MVQCGRVESLGRPRGEGDGACVVADSTCRDTDPDRNALLIRYYRGPGTFEDVGRLMRFVQRPWWQRMWVLQEVVVSKSATVQCGHKSLPWSRFEAISEAFVPQVVLIGSMVASGALDRHFGVSNHIAIIKALRAWQQNGTQLDLLSLVVKYRRNRVTDPRDKIFALLGLAAPAERDAFQADYGKNTAQVYMEFVKVLVERRKRLDVLAFCTLHRKTAGLPSWTPDWSCDCHLDHELPLSYDSLEVEVGGTRKPYRASGSRDAEVHFSADLRALTAQGVAICAVQTLGKEGSVEQRPEGELVTRGYTIPIAELVSLAEQATALSGSEARQLALMKVLVADRMPLGGEPNRADWQLYQTLLHESTDGRLWTMEHLVPATTPGSTTSPHPAPDVLNAISRTMRNRRLFISHLGHLGVAPAGAQEGDVVCILFGSSTPFVVRAHEQHFHLIGEAYIWHPKFMDGDVVDQGLVPTTTFELR